MTTTFLEPDSVVEDSLCRNSATGEAAAVATLDRDQECRSTLNSVAPDGDRVTQEQPNRPDAVVEPDANSGMTEEDTVSVLEVLAEMQRIIDRHLERTARQQDKS
ncbi:hypothetical protein H6M51_16720 [Rhizobium sp. AQ_MP]|uniref:hypothetical protein n=1 Tax=Rhizobium sp. AQ_MP TaxID=2761536 RepID=UPI0016398669|nr:hypothetical protein [Rhizobium sp. AQ_MP]MBC2774510.1 hypothetical protein [Rhizobium sp. AQ_MP]